MREKIVCHLDHPSFTRGLLKTHMQYVKSTKKLGQINLNGNLFWITHIFQFISHDLHIVGAQAMY